MIVRTAVDPDEALRRVRSAVGDRVSDPTTNHGQVDLRCAPEELPGVMTTLRDDPQLKCEFFTFLAGIDRSEAGGDGDDDRGGLEVLVHVYSPEHVIHVNVHVPIDWDDPRCPTISDIYTGALWHERECHEFFGIDFDGHPGLVSLYLPEDFEGHPGRRAFKLPSRALVKPWPGAKDPEEAAAGGR